MSREIQIYDQAAQLRDEIKYLNGLHEKYFGRVHVNQEWEAKSLAGTLKSVDTYSFEAGYAEGYKAAINRVEHLKDREALTQQIADVKQGRDFLAQMIRTVYEEYKKIGLISRDLMEEIEEVAL